MDHDQRFKALIREFFAEFMRLFFKIWADRLDLASVVWLDKEVLPDPPEGSRHVLDLVARVGLSQKAQEMPDCPEKLTALVHIEVESPDRTTRLKPRFPSYYVHLRDMYGFPVLPIAVYLNVGLDGIGIAQFEEKYWDFEILRFRYLYVGLPALDALEYVVGDNLLGVALSALMRIPPDRVAWLGAEALRRLAEAPLNEQQRFLLTDCVEAYLPLVEAQRQEFERLLTMPLQDKVIAMNKTTFDKVMEKGMEKGIVTGLQNALLRQGKTRWGPPSNDVEARIRSVQDEGRLDSLLDRMIVVDSWDDLVGNG